MGKHIATFCIFIIIGLYLLTTAGCSRTSIETVSLPVPTATATPVVVPTDWPIYLDNRLGYSIAVPIDWIMLDMHGGDFEEIAATLNEFEPLLQSMADIQIKEIVSTTTTLLNTPEGKSLGLIFVQPDFQPNPFSLIAGHLPVPTVFFVLAFSLPEDITIEDLVKSARVPTGIPEYISISGVDTEMIDSVSMLHMTINIDVEEQGMHLGLASETLGTIHNNMLYLITLLATPNEISDFVGLHKQIARSLRPQPSTR